ncbi:MAG: hypothetical protein EBU80_08955 [Chitinophagia bacterium]|jgi:hypothetical protein|nr:hypothetical protein [Chitinophagia bacterium]
MSTQNFSNHARMHPPYHYVSAPLLFAGLIGSIVNLVNSKPDGYYSASLLVLVFVLLLLIGGMVRTYALKAQDRAIRAEESLRHFILTGKPFDSRLNIRQIIALRFASDEELPTLAKRAAEESMRSKQIKEEIKNWREDNYRI